MIRKNLKVKLKKIDNIYHVSDIHIRLYQRHKEYRYVFERLYNKIKENVTNSIIYVGGDIAHAKTDMSPELVQMISNFLFSLAEIAPTVVITGNHDCNLNNSDRLDALTPIIDSINHKQLFYLKESGIYTMANIDFIVYSVFDTPDNYISPDESNNEIKICLYHGIIDGSIMGTGMKISADKVNLSTFNGFDLVPAGDVHKYQSLQKYSYEEKEIDEAQLSKFIKKGWKVLK